VQRLYMVSIDLGVRAKSRELMPAPGTEPAGHRFGETRYDRLGACTVNRLDGPKEATRTTVPCRILL